MATTSLILTLCLAGPTLAQAPVFPGLVSLKKDAFKADAPIEAKLVEVHPPTEDRLLRSLGQKRAVILLHGIRLPQLHKGKPTEAHLHDWQRPGSILVKALAHDADVFAFAYSQNTRLERIAEHPGLKNAIVKLKLLGYEDIVLMGHSAGGVLARLFVEDHPQSGVTKVVQVCAPNDGSSLAKASFAVRPEQEEFLHSLTRVERLKCSVLRGDKKIPEKVQFVCVVGVAGTYGDGVVSCQSQWPPELQKQGIPAVRLATTHFTVFRAPKTAERVAELVRDNHPRWPEEKVRSMHKSLLGDGR